ncbi:general substrate transporter [Aspergillus stella-maris]|uniref:general substrate transporter n=1 Tax=Aspergillus stella-maris TaxID=1810926 RepID=UPI003CCD5A7F
MSAKMSGEKAPSLKEPHQEQVEIGRRAETELSVRDAFRYYRPAVIWSVLISLTTVMESYDMQIVHSFYAFPQFQEKYGVQLDDGTYSIPAKWQLGLNLVALVGLMLGTFCNGWASERFGARKVIMVSLVFLTVFIAITFLAPSVEVLLVGELLCSIPWGFFAAATPSYASEICPLVLRGYLTTFVNLCWVMGRLISTGVLTGTLNISSEWSYRLPFALQWALPLPLFIVTWFAPESPWWLIRKGRVEEAEASLKRTISAPEGVVDTKPIIANIQNTIQIENDMQIGSSYRECFQGTNRLRSEISIVSWGCQLLPGWAIQNYITYFFTLAGLSSGDSFKITLGTLSLAFIGTCLSWVFQTHIGRRKIYITGLIAMLPLMTIVAFLGVAPEASDIHWAQSGLLMVWFFCYGCTIGPIPYAIASEIGASNLRIKTIALGRGAYYILSVINSVVSPYMLNKAEGNLKGKAAFPAVAFTMLLLLWAYFRLPETKGMSTETLDHLFHQKTPARKFKEEAKRFQ